MMSPPLSALSAVRVIFFGTPEFAVPSLEILLEMGLTPTVVTQPDKPAGRGHAVTPSPIRTRAETAGLSVLTPATLKDDSIRAFFSEPSDVAIVVAYGKFIPDRLLAVPRVGFLNLHPSLLPRYRGATPIQAALIAGDAKTGVTLMQLDKGMDSGPIFAQRSMNIANAHTGQSLSHDLAVLGAALLRDELPGILQGEKSPVAQNEAAATTTQLLTRESGKIQWAEPAAVIERRIRAYLPWPGTWTTFRGERLIIRRARVSPEQADSGRVASDAPFRVGCGQGSLLVEEIQLPGQRPIPAATALQALPVLGQQLV